MSSALERQRRIARTAGAARRAVAGEGAGAVVIALTAVFSIVLTLVILFVLRAIFGSLRVGEEEEAQGLDLSEHSESAYDHAV